MSTPVEDHFVAPRDEPKAVEGEAVVVPQSVGEATADPAPVSTSAPASPRRTPQVVRPGLFVARDVVGMVLPRVSVETGKAPIVEHDVVMQMRSGKRQRVPFPASRNLLDHPTAPVCFSGSPPRPPMQSVPVLWRDSSIAEWCSGSTPEVHVVFSSLVELVAEQVWFPENVREDCTLVIALWVFLTYLAPLFQTVPYLHIQGKRNSGKTTLMRLLAGVVHCPLNTSNASGPALFRMLELQGSTLLLDEAEMLGDGSEQSSQLKSILLSGYRVGSPVIRCVGEAHEVREFDVFGPKAIAGINDLSGPLASRCIPIFMERRPPGAAKSDGGRAEVQGVRDGLYALVLSYGLELRDRRLESEVRSDLQNRDADIWNPLFFLADWLETKGVVGVGAAVRAASEVLVQFDSDDDGLEVDDRIAVQALTHLHTRIVAGNGNCTPGDLVKELLTTGSEGSHRTPKSIAALLRVRGISTRKSSGKLSYRHVSADNVSKALAELGAPLKMDSAGGSKGQ